MKEKRVFMLDSEAIPRSSHKTLYDYINVGLALVAGVNRGIAFANQAFSSMHGYQYGELSVVSVDELIAPEGREEWHSAIERARSSDDSLALEIDLLRKDGSTFPALVRVTALYDDAQMKHLIEVQNREDQNTLLRALNEDRTLLLASLQQFPIPFALLEPGSYRPLIYSRGLLGLFQDPASVTDVALENGLGAIAAAVHHSSSGNSSLPVIVPAAITGFRKAVSVEEASILDAVGQQIGIVALLEAVEA